LILSPNHEGEGTQRRVSQFIPSTSQDCGTQLKAFGMQHFSGIFVGFLRATVVCKVLSLTVKEWSKESTLMPPCSCLKVSWGPTPGHLPTQQYSEQYCGFSDDFSAEWEKI